MRNKTSTTLIGNLKNFLKPILKVVDKRRKKIIPRIMVGIIKCKNVILADIGRAIKKRVQSLKTIENILSRHLNSRSWNEEELKRAYLKEIRAKVKEDTLIVVDPTEIVKPYAKRLEYLGYVKDGSSGEIEPGYWVFESVSVHGEEVHLLKSEIFSVEDPNTPSFHGNIERNLQNLFDELGKKGIYIYDRGFDRKEYIELNAQNVKFVMRLVGHRIVNDKENQRLGVIDEMCKRFEFKNAISLNIRKKSGRGVERKIIWYTWLEVKLPDVQGEFNLIISKGGKEYFFLLTNLKIESSIDAEKVLRIYVKRWEIEEVIRYVKQTTKLEKFLVRKLIAIKRVHLFAFLVCAFMFTLSKLSATQIKRLVYIGCCFNKKRRFIFYTIFSGVSAIFGAIENRTLQSVLKFLSSG